MNINYVGTIDGVEFDGGSAENYDLTIGSGSFIDDFETQLIGAHPGEQVNVNVTFPEQYENNPDLAGKDATFLVTINGISELPELTDEFVKENLSEYAQTVDEYRQYLRDTISCHIMDQDGHLLGKRSLNFSEIRTYLREINLQKGDSIHIAVIHNMRRESIPGIADVGMEMRLLTNQVAAGVNAKENKQQ